MLSAHSDCSESFYKKEIANGIDTQPSKTAEERIKMMEILKKFEESNLDDEEMFNTDDEDEDDDIIDRFKGIDVENAEYEDIWDRLTEEERKRFMKAIDNPESDLRKNLFVSEDECNPWWEGHLKNDGDGSQGVRQPELMKIPTTMVRPMTTPTGPPLIYNLCAICIAYAFATRHLNVSPLADTPTEAKDVISKLVPFLTEKKSNTVLTSVDSVVTDVWSRFDENAISNRTMSVLLRDAAHLIRTRPPIVLLSASRPRTPEAGHADVESHPNRYLVGVLSDCHRVYAESKHAAHKLLFYASYVLSTPPAVFQSLAVDLQDRSKEFVRDDKEVTIRSNAETNSQDDRGTGASTALSPSTFGRALITEL
ncbi:hypothetical protein V5O48_011411 [Marasmius crinis-equi]|uniref:Uncharacterized protein n=1 Tax=Marasmius crinis-equi TaxID=585013 RepID=A0ABR3F5X4_9AGAR